MTVAVDSQLDYPGHPCEPAGMQPLAGPRTRPGSSQEAQLQENQVEGRLSACQIQCGALILVASRCD